jgi:hypothetical protein
MDRLTLPPHFQNCWGRALLDRPLFVASRHMRQAEADLVDVFEALASLPTIMGGKDHSGYLNALGLDSARIDTLAPLLSQPPERYGRADLYFDGQALRLLEFNIAADAGGPDYSLLNEQLMQDPAFAAFAGRFRLGFRDTRGALVAALRAAADTVGRGIDPHCLILCATGGARTDATFLASLAEMMGANGLRTSVAEPDAVQISPSGVSTTAGAVDVVFRYFNLHDLVPRPPVWWHRLREAISRKRVALWTGADSAAYSNKAALALLKQPNVADRLTARQREAIDRLVPPCWHLASDPTHAECKRELRSYVQEHQSSLVLKGVHSYGGKDVLIGAETPAGDWTEALNRPRKGGWLVQQRVDAEPEMVWNPVAETFTAWRAVYGLFITPDAVGGGFARALPVDAGGVVNFSENALSRTAPIFTYDDDLGARDL